MRRLARAPLESVHVKWVEYFCRCHLLDFANPKVPLFPYLGHARAHDKVSREKGDLRRSIVVGVTAASILVKVTV